MDVKEIQTGTRPIRVLLVAPTFGAFGGIEAFVLAVADAVRRDPRFSLRVCFKRASGFTLQPGFAKIFDGIGLEFCARSSHALWSTVRWADVVHCQNASPDVAAFATLIGRPLVLTIHNGLPSGPALRRMMWRTAARAAAERWYNSRFVWNTWEPGGPRPGSAHVPTISRLPVARVDPAGRSGFVFLGRLVAGKGADVLIDAYLKTGLSPELWPLTIVGDGPQRDALERRGLRSGARGIRFAGFLDGDAKAKTLAAARWLVAPSHWSEPFGLTAIEARSVGVPCIVTEDGGLPEAAGRDALMCAPGDSDQLAALLRRAAGMPEDEYQARSDRTRSDLQREVVPMSFYADAYRRVLPRRPAA
jgi:glycosyltransferase involved in cell wall biosynthesis